jgi:hypothetical protein
MVTQRAQRHSIAALKRTGMGRDRGSDVSASQPVLADVLVVDHEVEEKPLGLGQRGNHPGGQAVGVDGDAQGRGARGKAWQVLGQGPFQQGDLVMVADEPQAGFGGMARLAAADKEAAGREMAEDVT